MLLLGTSAIRLIHMDLESGVLGGRFLVADFVEIFIFTRQGL